MKKSFSSKKPEVIHLRIFGCPVYIHIPKEKRTKLDPLGKKGIFVGYSESSKAYRIYFPGYKKIDVSMDVTFDEEIDYNKSKKRHVKELEEPEAPRIQYTTMNYATQDEDREIEEPQEPVYPPKEKNPHKRKLAWVREAIQHAERYGAPEEMHRERKRPSPNSSYVSLMCDIIEKEPSNDEEAVEKK